MSLRVFHIIFVIASVALSIYVSVWAWHEYMLTKASLMMTLSAVFVVSAVVLVVYGIKVYRKLMEIP